MTGNSVKLIIAAPISFNSLTSTVVFCFEKAGPFPGLDGITPDCVFDKLRFELLAYSRFRPIRKVVMINYMVNLKFRIIN